MSVKDKNQHFSPVPTWEEYGGEHADNEFFKVMQKILKKTKKGLRLSQ